MRDQLRTWMVAFAILLAGVAADGTAFAQAGPPLSGYLLVQGKDLAGRTVTLHGLEYQIYEGTILENAGGGVLTLEELRVPEPGVSILDPREVDGVYFEASQKKGNLVLERLRVVRSLPH